MMKYSLVCLLLCVVLLVSCARQVSLPKSSTVTPLSNSSPTLEATEAIATPTLIDRETVGTERYCRDISWSGLTAASFYSLQEGWIASRELLFHTQDGGQSWKTIGAMAGVIISLDFTDSEHGLAVDNCGNAYITHTAGDMWERITLPKENTYIHDIDFATPLSGYILAQGLLYVTRDGGLSWDTLQHPCSPDTSTSVSFPSEDVGWILCAGEPSAGSQGKVIWRTMTAGISWTEQAETNIAALSTDYLPIQGYGHQVYFLNESVGWVGMGRAEVGGLYHTSDSGAVWAFVESNTTSEVEQVMFFDENHGIGLSNPYERAYSTVVLLVTSDGGKTWRELPTSATLP